MEYVYKYVSFKQSHKKTLENILENNIYFSKTNDDFNKNDCVVLLEHDINLCGIFSTSDCFKNKHLWEKFGYGGSGVCIEYDLNKILATYSNIQHAKVKYTIADSQMSYDIFELPEKYKVEEEVRFVHSNIASDEDRIVSLLENTITRIFLGVDFFSCDTFRSKKLDFIKQINPNLPIIHLTNFFFFNSHKTLTKVDVIEKLKENTT